MNGWADLKEAFWAIVEGDPAERPRRLAALASIDPALPGRLEALLAADERGESLDSLFQGEPVPPARPARIGGYEVLGVLGVGGMGEVYRALDVRLQREVAIKVLPAALTTDRERLARFEREAQVLASLNHPHIARVYGLEESASTPALVMELVEGPTLAQVIAGGAEPPLTMARALTIARQIADGLDAAHEKGIIHRDLKPSNVALTLDGDVKILDFGVAKSLDNGAQKPVPAAVATDVGVVLGTPQYMSPEQARGLPVDKRTDVWSFGCLLYELLTRRQPFAGVTPSDSLAAVLEHQPDMSILPADTPAAVRTLLRHCFQKDPKRRLRDVADARLAIDDVLNGPADERLAVRMQDDDFPRARRRVLVPALWLLAGIGVTVAAAWFLPELLPERPRLEQPRRVIASIVLPRDLHLAGSDLETQGGSEARFAVSPDNRKIALIAADGNRRTRLWVRDLASAGFQPLPETEGASFPFWSPDSASIGFVTAGKLKTIRLDGGIPVTVHDAGFRAASWSRDNLILFTPAGSSPLYVLPAPGASLTRATTLDKTSGEVQHGYPTFLPDGRHFLYFSIGSASGALDPRGVYLSSLDSPGSTKLLVPGATQPRYANGHVLFVQKGTLLAQPFDVEQQTLRGAPVSLVEDVTLSTVGATGATAAYSVSDNVLGYQAAVRTDSRPMWFDRSGRQLAGLTPGDYGDVALSPDGTHLAVSLKDPARPTRDIWVYESDGSRGRRLTFDAGDEFAPVWSPDGTRLLFSAMSPETVNLHIKGVNRDDDAVALDADNLGLGRYAADWSGDGRNIMYISGGRAIAKSDLWTAPLANPRRAHALAESGFVETQTRFSPDGKWFLYASNETGKLQVYVDRFPGRGDKRLVSTGGGGWPRWGRSGREIFYVSADEQIMAAAVQITRERVDIAAPRPLFKLPPRPSGRLDAYTYDVSPDGRRFVVNTLVQDTTAVSITLVLNWTAALAGPR